jgi:hypothetical protein
VGINFQQTDTGGACTGLEANIRLASDGGSAGSTPVSLTITATVGRSAFPFEANPNLTAWAAGDYTVRLNVTTANMNLTVTAVDVFIYNSSCGSVGSIASSGVVSTSLSTTGVKSWTINDPSSHTRSATDKLIVRLTISNGAMSDQAFSFTPNQLIDTPLAAPADAGGAAPQDSLTQTDHTPAVAAGASVAAPADSLSQTDNAPVVSHDIPVPADSLAQTDNAPAVAAGASVAAPQDALAQVDNAPAVAAGASVAAPQDSLSQTDNTPAVGTGTIVAAPADALAQTDNNPAVAAGASVAAPDDSLTQTDNAPTVDAGSGGVTIDVPADSLSQTDNAPAVASGASVAAPADSLSQTDSEPAVGTGITLASPSDALIFSDLTPAVAGGASVAVTTDTFVQTDYAPTITAESVETAVSGVYPAHRGVKRRYILPNGKRFFGTQDELQAHIAKLPRKSVAAMGAKAPTKAMVLDLPDIDDLPVFQPRSYRLTPDDVSLARLRALADSEREKRDELRLRTMEDDALALLLTTII